MKKIYVYHHNDHDGIIAAGILFNDYYQALDISFDKIVFNMVDYTEDLSFDHIDLKKDVVWFLDYSFSSKHNQNEFEKLLNRREATKSTSVIWIDHHKSSIGLFDDYNVHGVRNTSLCGAALTYLYIRNKYLLENENLSETFHNNPKIPTYLKYIDDYDCWKKLYPETNNFHYGLTISCPSDKDMDELLKDSKRFINKTCQIGEAIQKYLAFDNKEYHVDMYGFEYTLPEEYGGYKCFCLNRKGNSLMFGDKINEYDAVIPFFYQDGKWKYSMFTVKDNVDCSEVAKKFGGGGHLKAAGWTSDNLIFK